MAEPTNLHTHGLYVSPEGAGDNVVTVAPGDSFDYDYRLPADHPTGVFWYHPPCTTTWPTGFETVHVTFDPPDRDGP